MIEIERGGRTQVVLSKKVARVWKLQFGRATILDILIVSRRDLFMSSNYLAVNLLPVNYLERRTGHGRTGKGTCCCVAVRSRGDRRAWVKVPRA